MRFRILFSLFGVAAVALCTGCPRAHLGTPRYLAEETNIQVAQHSTALLNDSGAVTGSGFADGEYMTMVWQDGETTRLDGLNPSSFLLTRGIANSGEVVGVEMDLTWPTTSHYLLWAEGAAQDLYQCSAAEFYVSGMNDTLTAAGEIYYVYEQKAMPVLFPPDGQPVLLPAYAGMAYDINNRGDVVGYGFLTRTDPGPGALLWSSGEAVRLESQGIAAASAINDSGTVVGHRLAFSGHQACVWKNRKYMSLPAPDGSSTIAVDINNAGWIVGALEGPETSEAVLWRPYPLRRGYEFVKLNDAVREGLGNWKLTRATCINERGQILAEAWSGSSGPLNFLLTPSCR